MKSLLVYCGASTGHNKLYTELAHDFGRLLAEKKIRLVYGGGSIGLMGVLADAVLENGGEVTGVIPDFLNTLEVGHTRLTQMHIVKSMHERKALMEQLSDAVVALPGGFGTLDELFEMLTWSQLGLHQKPVGLLNVNGYFDHLLTLLDHMQAEGFVKKQTRGLLHVSGNAEEILAVLNPKHIR
ncbi:MAG: Conserved hypothetical protein CHP00730 [Bacteroidetes bacterium]|nr:MAG: Conserved hypothetical protein CHP00730 [Bacteroidota bacterium]